MGRVHTVNQYTRGPQGPAGPQGAAGTNGTNGANANVVLKNPAGDSETLTNITAATAFVNHVYQFAAGTLNTVGKMFRFYGAGTLSVGASQSINVEPGVGGIAANIPGVNFGAATTGRFFYDLTYEVTANGAAGTLRCCGIISVSSDDGTYRYTHPVWYTFTADMTGPLTCQLYIAASIANNSFVSKMFIVESVN